MIVFFLERDSTVLCRTLYCGEVKILYLNTTEVFTLQNRFSTCFSLFFQRPLFSYLFYLNYWVTFENEITIKHDGTPITVPGFEMKNINILNAIQPANELFPVYRESR